MLFFSMGEKVLNKKCGGNNFYYSLCELGWYIIAGIIIGGRTWRTLKT
jgi:hypothetical protein